MITDQDILGLGWISEGKGLWSRGYFNLSYNEGQQRYEIEVDHGIMHMDEYFFDWRTLFDGRIETKEELAWVMKSVGIPAKL